MAHPGAPAAAWIEAENLTFQPAGRDGPTPLRGVTFRVRPGQTLLVAGPTGAGKSVLLRLIAGLGGLFPDPRAAGRLEVGYPGETARHQGTSAAGEGDGAVPCLPSVRPGRCVLVPQSPRDGLIGLDVFAALALPLEEQGVAPGETRRRVENALERFALSDCAQRDVASLSSGQARRVALAGVFAQDASLVILDEPFADLDPSGARRLQEDLERLAGRRTLVIAEHRTQRIQPIADVTLHLLPTNAEPASASRPPAWPVPRTAPESPPHVAAQGVSIRRGGRLLLEGLDLQLGPGVWGLLGPNGSGKTSLLWTLAGLLPPEAGTVDVAGVPVWRNGKRVRPRARHERRLRGRLQVAFQEPREAFFQADVRQELLAPLLALGLNDRATGADVVAKALEDAGRSALGECSPQRLSGGQARFVQLLGTLLPHPGVLLLDEPTHGLDASLRRDLRGLLAALCDRGHLVVVATHEPDVLPPDAGWLSIEGNRLVVEDAKRAAASGPAAFGFGDGTDRGARTRGSDGGQAVVRA